jgi:PBSX family phage terminase large subunit
LKKLVTGEDQFKEAQKRKEISPERLAWACADDMRRKRQHDIVKALGIPVPDCLLPLKSSKGNLVTPQQRKVRKAAISDALAFQEYVYGRDASTILARKRTLKSRVKKAAEFSEKREEIQGEIEAAPADAKDLDGPRVGDKPEKDPNTHEIDYEVLPSFMEFNNDMGSDCWLLVGPAGGGKSVAVVMKMLKHASTHDLARYIIVRNTYRQLHDTTMPTFFEWVPRHLGKYDAQQEKFTLAGRWEFLFRSCERAEDIDKFKGIEITGYFINEAMETKDDVKKILDQRVGRYPMEDYIDVNGVARRRGTSRVFRSLDTNPPDQEHWLYKSFVENPLEGHHFVLQPPYENAHNLPEGYYDRMREAYRDSPDLIDRYIEGKWGAVYRGKAVYKDYDSRVHLAKAPLKYIPGLRVYAGMDFGLTPACVWTQVTPMGRWHVIAEMCTDNTAAEEFADAVIAYSRQFFPGAEIEWFGDPAAWKRSETDASTVADVLANKGIYLTPGAITLTARLEGVRKRLRMRGGLVLSPTCTRLSTGFSGAYCFKEVGNTGYYTDKPEKNKWSHIHDALQYVASVIFDAGSDEDEARILDLFGQRTRPVDARVGY